MEKIIALLRKLQIRDWVIFGLIISVIVTNWVWYQRFADQTTTNNAAAASWQRHQVELNTIKDCINRSIKPCEMPGQAH